VDEGAWAVRCHAPAAAAPAYRRPHNVRNAWRPLPALAAACRWPPLPGRPGGFEPVKAARARWPCMPGPGVTVVDDTYNANPDSVRAAIAVLAELPGPRLLVLGDMGEVGDQGRSSMPRPARCAASGIEQLFAWAPERHAAAPSGRRPGISRTWPRCWQRCRALPGVGSVLVKGSRFMKMEQVVQAMEGACC
jgi:UDP-N-acetylmuramyl pentapeptide synthase